jgi:integrase
MHITNVTPHGFRSTFRDWASEEAFQFSGETVELAIGHTIKNKTEAAYRRGDQLERRRELMALWEEYIKSNMKRGGLEI